MKYEQLTTEFADDEEPLDWLESPLCVHCGKSIGYHWQTAEGKLFCTREVKDATDA